VDGYGLHALIFARDLSDPLTSLVKTIDKQLEKSSAGLKKGVGKLGVFVIFLNEDPGLKTQLQDLIARESVKRVVLTTHKAQAPSRYRIAREAELTVVIYRHDNDVIANFVLDAEELAERSDDIMKALRKVLP
jgi:hypothetical protein